MEEPVGLGDGVRGEQGMLLAVGEHLAGSWGVDLAVHDHVRYVYPLRPELPRHGLRERAQTELADREPREVRLAAQRRRGAGKQDRAAPRLDHRRKYLPGRVESPRAVRPEARIELLRREIQDTAHLEGAGVVDEDLRIPQLIAYQFEGGGDGVGIRGVGRDGQRRAPAAFELLPHPGNALFAARHEGEAEAFTGEASCHRRAEPGPDPKYRGHPVAHTSLLPCRVHALPLGNSYSSSDSDL